MWLQSFMKKQVFSSYWYVLSIFVQISGKWILLNLTRENQHNVGIDTGKPVCRGLQTTKVQSSLRSLESMISKLVTSEFSIF